MVLNRPSMTKKDRRRVTIGLSLTVIGGLLFFNFQSLLNNALKSQLQVKEGNDFTSAWNKNPFPISLDMYIFNIENPEEFASGAKAKLAEKGPYSYNMWLYKEIINFNEDQTKVRFWESQSFEFRDDSPNKLTDKVTVLNFPVYALANMVRSLINDLPLSFAIEPVAIGFVNILLMSHGESLVKELTVGELLNGYPFSILNTIDTVTRPLTWFGVQLPDTGMPDNKFGLLWTKNYTKGGPFEAYSGQKGTQLLKLLSFKDQSSLNFYNEPKCNQINGTEGSTLEVDVNKEKTYYVFTSDTCRTFDLIYEKDTWVNGIPTYRFIPNPKLFAGPSKNPENRCFCRTPENEEWCDGIFDLGPCLKGAPAAYSFPHFYGASNTLKNNVENMHPDPEKHQAFIDVEPFMGAPLQGAEKLQMNALLKPISYLAGFRNFPETVMPLMWMKKGAIINDEFTLKMRLAIWPLYLILMLIYGSFFGGMALLGFVGFRIYRAKSGQMPEMKNVGSLDGKRSESREPLQHDFAAKSSSDQLATVVEQQTPVAAAASVVPLSKTAAVHQHQSPAWHTASYSAVSRHTGPPQIYSQSVGHSSDSRFSNDALPHTAQYQREALQTAGDRFSVKPMAPVAPVPYPRLTYSNTTFQRPRIGPMSGVSPRVHSQSLETSRNTVVENERLPKRSEGAEQITPYPRLTYSSTTFQNPRVGPMSALSTRYGPAPLVSTLEKVDEAPAQNDVSPPAYSQPYPRLTYSSTTYHPGPRNGPMSGVSLHYNSQSVVADNNDENVSIQSESSFFPAESYPRLTYSNTTYYHQGPRAGPISAVSTNYVRQNGQNNLFESKSDEKFEDDYYNDVVDLDTQLDMPTSADYDKEELTWTSVNEAMSVKNDEVVTKKVETSKATKKTNENESRITWSPPGSID